MPTLKRIAHDSIARLLYALDVTRPARALAGRLTIATFHRVLPLERRADCPLPHLAVPPDCFREMLAYFAATFHCLPLADAVAAAKGPSRGRPLLSITFDDGMRDNFEFARPLLKEHGLRATFFAVAGNARTGELLWHDRLAYAAARALGSAARARDLAGRLREGLRDVVAAAPLESLLQQVDSSRPGGPSALALVRFAKSLAAPARDRLERTLSEAGGGAAIPAWEGLMDFSQLRELAHEGHEIGSHSMTHALLRRELAPDLERETAGSRALLRDAIGAEVRTFCYPDGAHDEEAVAAVRAAGYVAAVTTRAGTNGPDADLFTLRRHNLEAEANQAGDGSLAVERLALRLSSLFPRRN